MWSSPATCASPRPPTSTPGLRSPGTASRRGARQWRSWGRYKLVATLVDSLEGDHILATYSHSIFRPVVPVERLFEEILKIGTTQHFAIVDGDYLRELGMLAEIMDFEYHEIMN